MKVQVIANHHYNIIVLIFLVPFLLVVCNGNENEDESVVLKSYGSNYCIHVENPKPSTKTHHQSKPIVVLKHCHWTHDSKMKLSIHPVERDSSEYEDEENEGSTENRPSQHVTDYQKREYIIRGSRADCVITGSDHFKVKTGKCNVPLAKYFIKTVYIKEDGKNMPAYSHSDRDLNTQHQHHNIHQQNHVNIHLKNEKPEVAFKFEQQQKCLTVHMDEGRNNGNDIKMDSCNPEMKSQLWSICSLQGDCTRTYKFQTITTTVRPSTPSSTSKHETSTTQNTIILTNATTISSNNSVLLTDVADDYKRTFWFHSHSSSTATMMESTINCVALILASLFYYASQIYY